MKQNKLQKLEDALLDLLIYWLSTDNFLNFLRKTTTITPSRLEFRSRAALGGESFFHRQLNR